MAYYTEDLETSIRLALRFDLKWHPDEARSLAKILAEKVNPRLDVFTERD